MMKQFVARLLIGLLLFTSGGLDTYARNPRGFATGAVTPPSGPVFPQAASYAISAGAGTNSYNNPNQIAYMQHLNTVVVGPFDGWESFGTAYNGTANGSMHAYTQAVQSGSVQPGGTIVLSDYDSIVLNPNVATTNMVAANMDLLTTYPGGTHVMNGANHIGNPVTAGSQPTCCGPRTPVNYTIDYAFDYLANGGALGLAGNTVSTNPTLDGWYLDDTSPYVRYAGDWLRNGTTQGTDNTGTTPASLALKSALGTMMARVKSDKSGALVFANLGDLYIQPLDLTNYPQFDGGNAEHAIGWANSADVSGTWFDMMTIVARQKGSLKTGGILIFGHDNVLNTGADFYRTGAGQAWRYGLASASLAGAQWAPNPAGAQPNTTPSNTIGDYAAGHFGSWLWPDEMAVDPTTLIAYAFSDPNISLGTGWFGTEIDTGIVTTIWQGTIVRKRYQMANGRQLWIMLNTSKTTASTATYGQRMQAFSGTQVPSVNSGNNNITSESIPAADARFRITFP